MKEYALNGTRAPSTIQAIFLNQGVLGFLGIVPEYFEYEVRLYSPFGCSFPYETGFIGSIAENEHSSKDSGNALGFRCRLQRRICYMLG